jgi:biotin-dependent carboxylase-like uncharacterized protein
MTTEFRIVSAAPGTTVQDGGRAGWLHAGVPPSGPLDPTAHAAANLAVGNRAGAAALEIPLGSLRLALAGSLVWSIDGAEPVEGTSGDEIAVAAGDRAVRYVAVRGDIDVPVVLGSKATLLSAALGGLDGRALRAGDVLCVRLDTSPWRRLEHAPSVALPDEGVALRVRPGPHVGQFPAGALEHLLAHGWRVSARSDRVGTRLEGTPIPRDRDDRLPPCPMLRGAVQVTTDGTPIVLGPDHPVTGGYPVLAVVTRASQALLARLRPGKGLSFALEEGFG